MGLDIYQDEIDKLDLLIGDGINAENALRISASTWKADADGMKIRSKDVHLGGSKTKNASDLADRERKYRMYEDYIRLANNKAAEVSAWRLLREKQMEMKQGAAITENDISKLLATQGFTRDTLMVKERSLAEVTVSKGTAEAGNIAKMGDAQLKSAEIDNTAKRNKVILISAIVAVVIIIASVVAWKKYKPAKKK